MKRSGKQTGGGQTKKWGRCEGGLAGQTKCAMPVCAHTAGESLSPTDSDWEMERSGARAGGHRSLGHAQRSEVERSEPDGVRPVLRQQSVIFNNAERQRKDHSLPPRAILKDLITVKSESNLLDYAGRIANQ